MFSTLILRADKALAGAPDTVLTWSLIGTAGLLVIIAFLGNPVEKAAALAWAVMP